MRRDARETLSCLVHVEIIFFSMPTPAATARSYSSGTVAESCSAMPVEFKQRDLVVRAAALLLAGDDLADFAGDVLLADQSLGQRHIDLAVRPALADVVDENPRALQDARIELLVARSCRRRARRCACRARSIRP